MPYPKQDQPFRFEVVKKIAVLSSDPNGWTKELNLVSYNGAEPKYDIRTWDPSHTKMGKGVTMTYEEVAELAKALKDIEL